MRARGADVQDRRPRDPADPPREVPRSKCRSIPACRPGVVAGRRHSDSAAPPHGQRWCAHDAPKRYGMTIDVDRCTGCGACMVACAVENNIPPAHAGANDRKGITWIRVFKVDNGEEYPEQALGLRADALPAVRRRTRRARSVCPQQAVEWIPRPASSARCPSAAWAAATAWRPVRITRATSTGGIPQWPAGMEKTLNPDVAPRMRGVVEKCNFCHGRLHAAKQRAAAAGKREIDPADYIPACVEACPTGAIRFGDLNDPAVRAQPARQLPPAGKTGHRAQDPLPVAKGLGARASQTPRAAGSKENLPWIDNYHSRPEALLHRASSCCGSCRGSPCSRSALYCAGLCLVKGLNQTNMDNRFAFGLWIFLDLTVIALGAGAFFTGFLLYILKLHELRAVINSAVVIGLVCYSGAMAVLVVDVGQPLRAWFTFWYPNVHSMLTEVTFCISCYLTVLLIEYLPIVLKNRELREVPGFLVFEFELHKLVYVLAGVGTFLSFFHQGSLGGLYGVLRGRPFAFREGLAIWPSTFFLFILSAAAVGPSFILLTTRLVEKLSRKTLVRPRVLPAAGADLRTAAGRVRAGEDGRHADLDQPHFAGQRLPRRAVLQLAARSARGSCSRKSWSSA